jgi:hypothetical protein
MSAHSDSLDRDWLIVPIILFGAAAMVWLSFLNTREPSNPPMTPLRGEVSTTAPAPETDRFGHAVR